MTIKLYYFDFPGRAEAVRLILTVGGVEFEDVRFPREQWPELKPKTPFGQVPAMEVDGVWVGQSHALERYAAALGGLLPADPLKAALAEQALFQMDDAYMLVMPTMKLDGEAKIKARQELMKGAMGEKVGQIAKLLDGKKYLLGDELSYADLVLFATLSALISGFMDGITAAFLDDHLPLKAYHARIASHDKVKAYYAGKTGLYAAFQP